MLIQTLLLASNQKGHESEENNDEEDESAYNTTNHIKELIQRCEIEIDTKMNKSARTKQFLSDLKVGSS